VSRWLNRLQPWGVLLLRLVLGVAMLLHGYTLFFPSGGFHHASLLAALEHYAHYIAGLGMPPWLGYISAFTQFAGGICLILGLFTRFFAFLTAINMLVAIATVTLRGGYSTSQYPLALAAMAFMLLLTGPGRTALDRTIGLS
jgi:putative oxidoreductase